MEGSDLSWEAIEERDAKLTLWVPDHAATHCSGCHMEFWIVRRRHHCRSLVSLVQNYKHFVVY